MTGDMKIRKHKILDNHTIPGIFLLMFGGFFLMQFVIGAPLGFAATKLTGFPAVSCVALFCRSGWYNRSIFPFFLVQSRI